MSNLPLISVVTPTFNRANNYLRAAIESVLTQTYNNIEYIVVDDASVDNTEKLVRSFNDKRLIYYKNEHNRGEYWSTNFGMNLAKGKYVTWLHSDDLLPLNSLELRTRYLENNDLFDFVHGDIQKIDERGMALEKLKATDDTGVSVWKQYFNKLKSGKMAYLVHHTTIMMKKDFFKQVGLLDCDLPFAGDIDWLIRALQKGKYRRIAAVLYLYREHQLSRRRLDIKHSVDKEKIRKIIALRYADL